MTMRQVTLSSRHSEWIIFRDVEADDDISAVSKALGQVGGSRGWRLLFVHKIRKPEGLARHRRLELELF